MSNNILIKPKTNIGWNKMLSNINPTNIPKQTLKVVHTLSSVKL